MRTRYNRWRVASLALAFASSGANAGYGLTMASFGVESVGMGGADLATTESSLAVNINPSGLTRLSGQQIDAFVNPYYGMRTGHSDEYGNNQERLDNPVGGTFAISYAHRLTAQPRLVLGGGLFVQGGAGFEYKGLETAFGTIDETDVSLGIIKLAVGAGWRVSDQLSVGATAGLHYASFRQQLFPNTSDASAGFFGSRFDGGWDVAPNLKLGLQYRPTSTVTIGAAYSSRTDFDLRHATATVNYESLGLGKVQYRDAKLDGIALAQDLGVSVAWQAAPRLLLASELTWLDWSESMHGLRLRARNPDTPGLPAALNSIEAVSPLDWRDQYAVAIGAEWKQSENTTFRAGFNRVNRVTPARTLSPLLNLIQEKEITTGISQKIGANLNLGFAVQYQFLQHAEYRNPTLPFGSSAREDYELVAVVFSIAHRW